MPSLNHAASFVDSGRFGSPTGKLAVDNKQMAFAAYTGEAVQPAGDNSKASQLGKMRWGLSLGKVSTIRFSVLVILVISSPLCLQSFRTFCSVTGSNWQDDFTSV
jgi:hypothetical protein